MIRSDVGVTDVALPAPDGGFVPELGRTVLTTCLEALFSACNAFCFFAITYPFRAR